MTGNRAELKDCDLPGSSHMCTVKPMDRGLEAQTEVKLGGVGGLHEKKDYWIDNNRFRSYLPQI